MIIFVLPRMVTFTNLKISDKIIKILKESNINTPTKIQIDVLKSFKNDLIVQSPTGTGKTLAFLLPIAENFHKKNISSVFAVVLAPTRELALQIAEVLKMLQVTCTTLIGGTKDAEKYESVIIATPGRFIKVLLNSKEIFIDENKKTLFSCLKKLDFLILDEADKLLSLGFRSQLFSITREIKSKRNALFSATFNDNISSLCKNFLKSPKFIKNEQKIFLDIKFIRAQPFQKIFYLMEIFKNKKVIVFFLTCNEVDYFMDLFQLFGYKDIVKIHGKMNQDERNAVYSSFNSILFGTDLASRGIDFKDVDVVVHFDIPLDPESFLHRSGRSGRNNQQGKALLLISKNEEKYLNYLKIKNIEIEEEICDTQIEKNVNEIIKRLKNSENYKSSENIDVKKISEPENIEERGHGELMNFVDEELRKKSVKAFVSHIAAYKEHALKYLLDFQKMDFDSLANLHFLQKIPTMKEISGVKFKNFVKPKKKDN